MDPFTAASGVIGVVGVAVQLAQTASAIISFLEMVADAPEEVTRLTGLVKAIHAGSARMRDALKGQREINDEDKSECNEIFGALDECQKRLVKVQRLLNKVGDLQSRQTMVARNWAKLKMASKKDDIIEIERQLGRDLDVMNYLLTSNIMCQLRSNRDAATCNTNAIIEKIDSIALRIGPLQPLQDISTLSYNGIAATEQFRDSNTSEVRRGSQFQLLQSSTSTMTGSFGVNLLGSLTSTKKRKRSIYKNSKGRDIETITVSKSYAVTSTWFSRSIELVIDRSGYCYPSFSISMNHIIPLDIFNLRMEQLFNIDDVCGIQQLIMDGTCTINSSLETNWSLISVSSSQQFWIIN